MNQMVIGATLQGKPAWFTIENKYDSPGNQYGVCESCYSMRNRGYGYWGDEWF